MKRKCDEVFCKFNDLTKSIECFYKKHKSAFTVAELVVTIIVVGVLVFVLLGFVNRDQQQEFDAKNYEKQLQYYSMYSGKYNVKDLSICSCSMPI